MGNLMIFLLQLHGMIYVEVTYAEFFIRIMPLTHIVMMPIIKDQLETHVIQSNLASVSHFAIFLYSHGWEPLRLGPVEILRLPQR